MAAKNNSPGNATILQFIRGWSIAAVYMGALFFILGIILIFLDIIKYQSNVLKYIGIVMMIPSIIVFAIYFIILKSTKK
ncbi:hypothetical protein HN604_03340 [archaeon]|jgi:hypothetical protein|nr:hypothetical protein [archaeon]MBT6182631.1 hypothetical protein [archaeon]MBT6606209.1 hypothetical protein [archaeon]MBT7251622.1 hypothetical protein [archaeon]MBT7661088.1 hypothetical protein [archaeon]